MSAKELREQRAELIKEMQALANKVTEEERSMSYDEMAEYDNLDNEAKELLDKAETEERCEKARGLIEPEIKEQRVDRRQVLTNRDRELAMRAWVCRASGNDSLVKDSWLEAANKCRVNMNDRGLKMAIEDRAGQTVGTSTEGGYLTSSDTFVGMDQATLAYGGMLQNCRVLRTSNGNQIHFATVDDTSNSASIVGENTEVTSTDLVFGTKVLDAYKYVTAAFPVSIELIEDSEYPLIPYIEEALGERLGRKWNYDLTLGTGSDQPQGVVPAVEVGKTATLTTSVSASELIDLYHSVDASYRSNAIWMMNDQTFASIRKIVSDDGHFLFSGLHDGERHDLLGKKVVINNSMSDMEAESKSILFGNFSKYVARIVNNVSVLIARERYIDTLSVAFFGYGRMDGELLTNAIKCMQQAAS